MPLKSRTSGKPNLERSDGATKTVKRPKAQLFKVGRRLMLELGGEEFELSKWAHDNGINYVRLWQRIFKLNWPLETALFEPVDTTPARMHGTLDMAVRMKCRCKECKHVLSLAGGPRAKYVQSKAPHPDDQGKWFDKGTERFIKYQGKRLTVSGWAHEIGINPVTLTQRLFELKMPVKEALNRPVRPYGGEPVHGLKSTYDYHRCRCELCREANRNYCRELAQRKKDESSLNQSNRVNATRTTANRT